MRGLPFFAMLIALFSPPIFARASDAVLLFESPALRPELCAALRIQLTDLASVRCTPSPAQGGGLSQRMQEAAAIVAREQARLGVLLARDSDPGLVQMVLVGARAEQALLAIERIEDRPAPDVDRSLALKVRDALELLIESEAALASRAPEARQRAPFAPLLSPRKPPAEAPKPSLLLEAGAGLSRGEHTRALGLFALAARRTRVRRYGELGLSAQLGSRTSVRGAQGDVVEDEWALSLFVRAGAALRRVALGGFSELGILRVEAWGSTRDRSSEGEAALALPRLALGGELRLLLLRGLSLRLSPALELYPIAQQFALDRKVSLELGRLRALVPLSLVFELPLARVGVDDAN